MMLMPMPMLMLMLTLIISAAALSSQDLQPILGPKIAAGLFDP